MDKTLAALNSEKAGEREKALEGMQAGEMTEAVIQKVLTIIEQDNNENVRIAACKLVGKHPKPEAISILIKLVTSPSTKNAIRLEVVSALGEFGEHREILQCLNELLSQNGNRDIGNRVIETLVKKSGKSSANVLAGHIRIRNKDLKARIIKELGNLSEYFSDEDSSSLLLQLREVATTDSDANVRRASISSSAKYSGDHSPFLKERFYAETDEKNKIRCVALLGEIGDDYALEALSDLVFSELKEIIRDEVVKAMSKIKQWRKKAYAILAFIDKNNELHRPGINAPEIILAIEGEEGSVRKELGGIWVNHAVGATARVKAVIASLLIATVGGNVNEAGNFINQYVKSNPDTEEQLHQLRIEVGGTSSLEPILQKLQDNLEHHFQKPVTELNKLTTNNWIMTVKCVYWGFVARLAMSVCTFLAGLCLTIWSVYQFSLDKESASAIWGAGVSMFAGIGSMLVIIYTGPLKDIGKSVEELAKANAIFIGFIHAVLQISHTFSAKYIRGDFSFEETAQSNQLVQNTVRSAVENLTFVESDIDSVPA